MKKKWQLTKNWKYFVKVVQLREAENGAQNVHRNAGRFSILWKWSQSRDIVCTARRKRKEKNERKKKGKHYISQSIGETSWQKLHEFI